MPDDEDGDRTAPAEVPAPPIVPGSPSAENALFVLLGVLTAVAVLFRLVRLFG